MSTSINNRASVFAIVKEVTSGTPVSPSSGDDFIPLRPANSMSSTFEVLENDEMKSGIGKSKSVLGKETPEGTHPVYIKHSEIEGQEPEVGVLWESLMGDKTVNSTEYDTITGSTTTVIKVDTGEGSHFEIGQALLVKDGTNGYSIANITSISGDDLTIAFALDNAPSSGINLGKAILYKPVGSGHPTFTAWKYAGNGGGIQMEKGCAIEGFSANATASQQLEGEFKYSGTGTYFNPIEITSSNDDFSFTDGSGTVTGSITQKIYKNPIALADALATAMTAASVGSDDDTITVTYSSTTGKFTIASDGTTLSLGCDVSNSIFVKLGFGSIALTGSLTYTAATEMSWAAEYTASYDDASNIVAKNNEIMIGDATDNFCRKFGNISVEINKEQEDVETICSETGVLEKTATGRTATISGEIVLEKHQVDLFNKFINNSDVAVTANFGTKDSSGNWIAGKCFNVFFPQATVTARDLGGENFVTISVTITGYMNSSKKEVYINYV